MSTNIAFQLSVNNDNNQDLKASLQKVLKLYPDHAPAHHDLGGVYYQNGDNHNALVHYEKAVEIDPGNVIYQKSLADFYYSVAGRVEEALSMYLKVLDQQPSNMAALLMAGHLSVVLQEFSDGEGFYKRVLEIEPWHQDASLCLEKLQNRHKGGAGPASAEDQYADIQSMINDGRAVEVGGVLETLPRAMDDNNISPKYAKEVSGLKKLNLGCGNRYHTAWTNIDFKPADGKVLAHNLLQGIPFNSESFDVIYHSHLLEHFPKADAPKFLKECFRVLKPGGIIRVVVPDLEQIAKYYLSLLAKSLQGDKEAQKQYEWIVIELFDQMVRNVSGGEMFGYWKQNPMPAESFVVKRMGSEVLNALINIRKNNNKYIDNPEEKTLSNPQKIGEFRLSGEIHQWMYDRYSLGVLLRQVGFKDVKVRLANESQIPKFNSYLLDIESDGAVRKPESLFMEGIKIAS